MMTYQSSEAILMVMWLDKVPDGAFELRDVREDSRIADSSRG